MNIYTVKWGSKYSAKHVNKIYESCLEHISQDFTFYCLTEKPKGLDENIKKIIPFGYCYSDSSITYEQFYEKRANKVKKNSFINENGISTRCGRVVTPVAIRLYGARVKLDGNLIAVVNPKNVPSPAHNS